MPLPFAKEDLNTMSDEELLALKGKLEQHKQTLVKPKPRFNLTGGILGGLRGFTEGKIPEPMEHKKTLADEMAELEEREKIKAKYAPTTQNITIVDPNTGELKTVTSPKGPIMREPAATPTLNEEVPAPEGYDYGYSKEGKRILIPSKKSSSTEQYRNDLRDAKQRIETGEDVDAVFADLEDKYPEKDFMELKLRYSQNAPKTGAISTTPKPVGRFNPLRALPGFAHYPTATNPTTGEKVIFKDGKWQPYR